MIDPPLGWAETTLGEIADTSLGKMLDRGKATGEHAVPYLRNTNVQWGQIHLDDVLTMDILRSERDFFQLKPGDLLICEGGEIGRSAIWSGQSGYMAYQKALHRVRPLGGVEVKYIRYLMEHLSLAGLLIPYSTGSTIKHLPQEQLRRISFYLPPTAEQCRIVAVLEDYLSRLDVATQAIISAGRRAQLLWLSMLNSIAMGGSTGISDRIKIKSVAEVAQVQGGIQKQYKRRPIKNTFPFLRVANVSRGGLDLSEVHTIELFEGEIERYRLEEGDLLVVEGNGSPEHIGRAAMWRNEISNCVHQNHLIRVRPGPELDPRYLEYVWNAPEIAQALRLVASSTSGLFTLSTAKVKSIKIPVPPLATQEQLVAEAQHRRANLDIAERSIKNGYRRAESLRCSLLAQAFTGRLVEQNAMDEPASVLLQRIRAERGARGPTRRSRRYTGQLAPQKETLL